MHAVAALLILLLMLMPTRSAVDPGTRHSTVSRAESLVLFATAARLSADGRQWLIPLHGWVYVPQHSRARKAAIAEVFKLKYQLQVTPESAPYFDSRINLLLADNKRGRRIMLEVAGDTSELNV